MSASRCAAAIACVVLLIAPALSAKVAVDFYGEALCPFCSRFTTTTVAPLFANNVSDLMTFTYVPWGNAQLDSATGAVTCQHGPQECLLNTLISCVQDIIPAQSAWFPAVDCIETVGFSERDVQKVILKCVPSSGGVAQRVADCYGGE